MRKQNSSPKNKNRSHPKQQMDKYINLAHDAASTGDRVAAERYYQHADHYYRVSQEMRPQPKVANKPKGAANLAVS